jgi:hypothetical protein
MVVHDLRTGLKTELIRYYFSFSLRNLAVFRILLIGSVVTANAIVFGIMAYGLATEKASMEQETRMATANFATLLDQNITETARKIDFLLKEIIEHLD